MENISIFVWNIYQQGGNGKGNIPPWVKDEVSASDIVVLTEFCTKCKGRTAFITDLEQLGYCCAASENSSGNDILIAVKSCFPISAVIWETCYGVNNPDSVPENLRVDIDCDGSILSVVGVRIKTLDNFKMRKRQFQWVLNQILDIKHPILIAGDFNHGKRGSRNSDWSISIMEDMLKSVGFALYTPKGSSIYCEENCNGTEFPDDHFAAKGAKVSEPLYDRKFTEHNPEVYCWGRDFREPWSPRAKVKSVKPPFPDHAILTGTLHFPAQKEWLP